MALNLWALAGVPTSYSPLTTGFVGRDIYVGIGEYTFSFEARSISSARMRVYTGDTFFIQLSTSYQLFSYTFKRTVGGSLIWLNDVYATNDIEVRNIRLVNKSLDKATLNGLSIDPADWENGSITSLGVYSSPEDSVNMRLKNTIAVTPGAEYYLQLKGATLVVAHYWDSLKNYVGYLSIQVPGVLKVPSNAVALNIRFYLGLDKLIKPSDIVAVQPVLTMGTLPVPYSKKTGSRMVPILTGKKNLLPSGTLQKGYNIGPGLTPDPIYRVVSIYLTPGNYAMAINNPAYDQMGLRVTLATGENLITSYTLNKVLFTLSASSLVHLNIRYKDSRAIIEDLDVAKLQMQLEVGTVHTAYEPFTPLLNAKPKITRPIKTGVPFDGFKQYITLPVTGVDRIEVDCVFLDGIAFDAVVVDLRQASSNSASFVRLSGANVGNVGLTLDGAPHIGKYPTNTRHKIGFSLPNLTGTVFLFGSMAIGAFAKGIMYGIKVYKGSTLVDSYDLTNPASSMGDKLLQNSTNLLPSFDSPKWTLHSAFKVLGKDYATMSATAIFINDCMVTWEPNTTYLISIQGGPRSGILARTADNSNLIANLYEGHALFTTGNSPGQGYVRIYSAASGEHTFIKPTLIKLPKTFGTLHGSVERQLKAPKRVLYNLR